MLQITNKSNITPTLTVEIKYGFTKNIILLQPEVLNTMLRCDMAIIFGRIDKNLEPYQLTFTIIKRSIQVPYLPKYTSIDTT
jgi:hypothetical protein